MTGTQYRTSPSNLESLNDVEKEVKEEVVDLLPGPEPLVLRQPDESGEDCVSSKPIVVDTLLVRFLRPHQRYFLNPFLFFFCIFLLVLLI